MYCACAAVNVSEAGLSRVGRWYLFLFKTNPHPIRIIHLSSIRASSGRCNCRSGKRSELGWMHWRCIPRPTQRAAPAAGRQGKGVGSAVAPSNRPPCLSTKEHQQPARLPLLLHGQALRHRSCTFQQRNPELFSLHSLAAVLLSLAIAVSRGDISCQY